MKKVTVVTGLQTETVYVDDHQDRYQAREAMFNNRGPVSFSSMADQKVTVHPVPIHEYLLFMRDESSRDPFAKPIVKEQVYFCLDISDDKLIRQIAATFEQRLKDKDARIHNLNKVNDHLSLLIRKSNELLDKYQGASWITRLVRVFNPAYKI